MHITFKQVLRTAREVVAERPDHIDRTSMFAGEVGCLSGVVLHRLGVNTYRSSLPMQALREEKVSAEQGVGAYLELLMMLNDAGQRWSRIIADGDLFVKELVKEGILSSDPGEDDDEGDLVPAVVKVTINHGDSLRFYKAITEGHRTLVPQQLSIHT